MYVCIYVFFNAPKRASCSLSLSIFLFSVRCSLSTQQIIITSRSLPSSVWALGSSSSSTDMPVAVSIALVLSSFICSSFPLAFFFFLPPFFFKKKTNDYTSHYQSYDYRKGKHSSSESEASRRHRRRRRRQFVRGRKERKENYHQQ